MPDKTFDRTIPFYPGGPTGVPVVTATLVQTSGNRVNLPLLFDTGASVTTLRHDLYALLGVPSWDSGQPVDIQTAGGQALVKAYRYQARFEVFGKKIDAAVHLAQLPRHPLYLGLFGREDIFQEFGFGFWESSAELLVALNP